MPPLGHKPLGSVAWAPDWTNPLARGLTGLWLLNEGAGEQVADLGPYTSTAQFTSTGGDSPSWAAGDRGCVVYAENQAHLRATVALGTTNTVTLMARVRLRSALQSWAGFVFSHFTGTTSGMQHISSTGKLGWLWAGSTTFSGGPTLKGVGTWQLCTTVVTPDDITTYVDLDSYTWTRSNGAVDLTGDWNIANERSSQLSSRYLDAEVDFAAIWSRALTAEEIANLYHEPYQLAALPARTWWWASEDAVPSEPEAPLRSTRATRLLDSRRSTSVARAVRTTDPYTAVK
jgi:hypothetical protein